MLKKGGFWAILLFLILNITIATASTTVTNNIIQTTGRLSVSGNGTILGTSFKVNNKEVCLADGTNCLNSSNYISLYTSGNFNGSLYTTSTDPSASLSNSIFQVKGSDGTPRFQVQDGGPEQASFIARSFMVVNQNNTLLNSSQNDLCGDWGFNQIDCDTSTTGADLGVTDDAQILGLLYSSGLRAYSREEKQRALLVASENVTEIYGGLNGSYDVATNYFCDYVSDNFVEPADGWININDVNSDFEGAWANYRSYINSSCIELYNNPGWETSFNNTEWRLMNNPSLIVLKSGLMQYYVGDEEQSVFEVDISNGTGFSGFYVDDVAGADQHKSSFFETDINGFNGVVGILNQVYSSTNVIGIVSSNILLEFLASRFNNSIHDFFDIRISGEKASGMDINLFSLEGDFDSYIKQGGADSISKVYYDDAAGATVDITAAATSTSSNVTIFENDDSILYIGGTTNFTQISIDLESGSSANINEEFYYCNSSGEWETYLGGIADTTVGFTKSGSINAQSPDDRGVCNKELDGTPFADANNYTYIAIKRTRNNIVNPPVESLFSVGGGETSFILADDYIKLHGIISPPFSCDSAVDGAIYYDTSSKFHCSCKAGTGWVQMNDYATPCS